MSKTHPTELINSADDMRWLREQYLPELGQKFKSAVLYGNPSTPEAIEVFARKEPLATDKGVRYELSDHYCGDGVCRCEFTWKRVASRSNPPAALSTSVAPSDDASCGDGKDAIGAGAAAIGVNVALGLVSGVAAALASAGDKSTPVKRARAAKRGMVVGVGVHSVASLALGLATARTHPFFSGATTYIGLSGVLLTTVAVFVPAEQIAERATQGTPLPSPSGTSSSSLPGSSTSPVVSAGGALGVMPGAPTVDPLRLTNLPRLQKSPMDTVFPGVIKPPAATPAQPPRIVGETYAPAGPSATPAGGGSIPLTNGTPIVSEGDRRALRQVWKALALPSTGLEAWFRNGAVDPDTVRAFQTAYNRRQAMIAAGKLRGFLCEPRQLQVDGIIGRNTTAALQCMAALTDSQGGWSLSGNAATAHYGNPVQGTVAPAGALGAASTGVLEVQVRSNTRTTIEVDGRALAGREARLRLTPGRHLLRVLATDCDRSFEADVDIVSGQVTPAVVDLFC